MFFFVDQELLFLIICKNVLSNESVRLEILVFPSSVGGPRGRDHMVVGFTTTA